jgi:sulfonate transport system ATP-binding protein
MRDTELGMAADIAIRGLDKTFAQASGPVRALAGIHLDVPAGSFVSIVGASGCGKSTLLRILAGLEAGFEGGVEIGGKPVGPPGLDRGMVFQEHRLLPWLNVEDNVAFALSGRPAAEVKARVAANLDLVGLAGFARAYPHQLSGGMSQRVAIARALVNRPSVLLLDEPFGALDAMTKIVMQQEILRIWQAEGTTMILVTHDIDEAIFLGDRVVVMSSRPGTIRTDLRVDLPRPRDRSSPAFAEIRRQVFGEFFHEAEAPFAYVI